MNLDHKDEAKAIARACVTIKDDAVIAQFYGVSPEYVAEQRAKIPVRKTISLNFSSGSRYGNIGPDKTSRDAAAKASQALNERIWRMYEGIAEKRGLVDVYEAAALCGMSA